LCAGAALIPCTAFLSYLFSQELLEKKMQRLEKAKETETAELRAKLESAQGDVRVQLKAKDDKISEVRG
jgi:hypothetical protein